VSLQYGLCARNQEIWGMRWSSLKEGFAWVLEVLSNGRLDEWGKTEHSTQRRTVIPSLLQEDLAQWRNALEDFGHPVGALDFIIPGDLAGREHGAHDPRTGACHFSENQARAPSGVLRAPNKPNAKPRRAHPVCSPPATRRTLAARSSTGSTPTDESKR
jgi:hypothetical protein